MTERPRSLVLIDRVRSAGKEPSPSAPPSIPWPTRDAMFICRMVTETEGDSPAIWCVNVVRIAAPGTPAPDPYPTFPATLTWLFE